MVLRLSRRALCVAAVLTLLVLAACRSEPPPASDTQPARPAPNFTLSDQRGQTFRLSDQRGKVVLLNFGYTNCPDVCPIALAQLAQVRRDLGAQAAQVEVVFVTTDPVRDKPQRLTDYLQAFDPQFIGLTGPTQALRQVWAAYHVQVDPGGPDAPTPSAAEWDTKVYDVIGHSAVTYLIDPAGNVRAMYPAEWPADQMLPDVKAALGK